MIQAFETLAAIRFGYGFRPGEPDLQDVGELLAQLQGPDTVMARLPTPGYAERRQILVDYRIQVGRVKKLGDVAKADLKRTKRARRVLVAQDIGKRFARAIVSPNGFRERLASFWADHFTVVPKGQGQVIQYGGFMDVAIRPNIAKRFADILIASTTHPSMISFLDQGKSIGPNSKGGKNNDRGLNENLAREVLELHTLGVGASYDQNDVRQLAELLTGLTTTDQGTVFKQNIAEPGAETVLGKQYGGGRASMDDITAFLEDVAIHPQTAAHISRKLAVHFVSDQPDPALVAHMTQVFLRSGGDLMAVYGAMLEHPSSWGALGEKVKQPFGFIVSGMRALNVPESQLSALSLRDVRTTYGLPMVSMGQPILKAPGPNGWPEEAEAWITPQGLAARLQWALVASSQYGNGLDPRVFVDEALRDLAGGTLKFAVSGAERRVEGLTLVLASPEFNRR